jgi:hypothetical protein
MKYDSDGTAFVAFVNEMRTFVAVDIEARFQRENTDEA